MTANILALCPRAEHKPTLPDGSWAKKKTPPDRSQAGPKSEPRDPWGPGRLHIAQTTAKLQWPSFLSPHQGPACRMLYTPSGAAFLCGDRGRARTCTP